MQTLKNVGIWIRVSTEMQVAGDSPEHHEERARMYANAKGWNVITVYRLDALSGKSIMDYAETKRMLSDIKHGVISGLIFSKLARLARNTKELLDFSELFRNCDADLISLAESIDTSTPAGRLFYTIIAAMAQWEREEIAERVAASVPIRAKLGKPLGGQASFGYKWNGRELSIDENEAPIRKQLYEVFLQTKRKKATASKLNDLGYRTRNGSKFSDTTITRLLRDPTAKGTRRANYTKSLGEKKNWVIKPKSEWIEIACPAIVEESLWNECNSILDQQEKKRIPKGPKTVHLLSGYLYCDCGEKMYVYTETPVYKCKQCKRKIDAPDIDEIYHEQLKSFLLTEADIASVEKASGSILSEKEMLYKTTLQEFNTLKKKIADLTTLRLNGELQKDDFAYLYKPIEEQVRQLELQLPELQADIDFLKIQNLSADTIIEDAKNLYAQWPVLAFEEKRNIIETITEKIVIHANSIDIALAYLPESLLSTNAGKKQHNLTDSWKQST